MSGNTTIFVPEKMSCVNAFRALWLAATPGCYVYDYHPRLQTELEKVVDTSEKVAILFERQTFFGRIGGRDLYVDFSKFPEIDVTRYEKLYGFLSADKILKKYDTIPDLQRFDQYDLCFFQALQSQEKWDVLKKQFGDTCIGLKKEDLQCKFEVKKNPPFISISLRKDLYKKKH